MFVKLSFLTINCIKVQIRARGGRRDSEIVSNLKTCEPVLGMHRHVARRSHKIGKSTECTCTMPKYQQ